MSDVYLWETYDRLGREAMDRGDLKQADEAFRSAVATAEEIKSQDRLVLSLRNLSAVMAASGAQGDAHELLSRTLEIAEKALDPGHSQTIETKRDLAGVSRDLGFLEKAEGLLNDVLEHELQQGANDSLTETLVGLAELARARENFPAATAYYERILKLRIRHLGEVHPEVSQAHIWLSTSLFKTGRSGEASQHLEKAFQQLEHQFQSEPVQLAQGLLAGAQLMVEAGKPEAALPHQKRALDLYSEALGPEDSRLWEARELIATTLAGAGKTEEAVELLEFCVMSRPPEENPQYGATLKNLGALYLTLGKTERAEEYYQKASDVLDRTVGKEHPAYLATQEERIQLYHFSNRPGEALQLALQTIKATEGRFGPDHPSTAQAYASTALLAHNAGEWKVALELMRAAEKIWAGLRPPPEDVLANCRTNIATCLLRLGLHTEAEQELNRAEELAGPSLRPVIANLREELAALAPPENQNEAEEAPEPRSEAGEKEASEDISDPIQAEAELPRSEPEAREPEESGQESSELTNLFDEEDDEFSLPDIDDPAAPTATASPLAEEDEDDEYALPDVTESGIAEPVASQEPVVAAEPAASQEPVETAEPAASQEPVETAEPAASQEPIATAAEPVATPEPVAEEHAPEVRDASLEEPPDEGESEFSLEREESLESEDDEPAVAVSEPKEPPRPKVFVERRSAPRNPLSLNQIFDLKIEAEDGADELKSFLVDLAPGGIRINSEAPFPAGGELTLTLPQEVLGEVTRLKAEVVWQKPLYGASFLQGLVFKDLTPGLRQLLDARLNPDNGNSRPNSRQHFRLYRPFPIKLREEGGEEWLTSYATDLSVNGLGTRLKSSLEQGNSVKVRLELEFELPTVEVEARVAWSREGENGVTHGLQFAEVGPVEAKTIKRYIDRCLEFSPD